MILIHNIFRVRKWNKLGQLISHVQMFWMKVVTRWIIINWRMKLNKLNQQSQFQLTHWPLGLKRPLSRVLLYRLETTLRGTEMVF